MDDWKGLPLSQLKKLIKGRAGRIAELQMEIKVLEGLVEARVRSGDFGEEKTEKAPPKEKAVKQAPQKPAQAHDTVPETRSAPQPRPQTFQPVQETLQAAPVQAPQGQQLMGQRPNVTRSLDAPQVYGSQDNGDEQEEPAQKKKVVNTFIEL